MSRAQSDPRASAREQDVLETVSDPTGCIWQVKALPIYSEDGLAVRYAYTSRAETFSDALRLLKFFRPSQNARLFMERAEGKLLSHQPPRVRRHRMV